MLPFLKKNKEASVAMPVDHVKRESDHEVVYDSLHSAAEDLMHAVHGRDVKNIAEALRAAFQICEAEPHAEGPHEEG